MQNTTLLVRLLHPTLNDACPTQSFDIAWLGPPGLESLACAWTTVSFQGRQQTCVEQLARLYFENEPPSRIFGDQYLCHGQSFQPPFYGRLPGAASESTKILQWQKGGSVTRVWNERHGSCRQTVRSKILCNRSKCEF